MLHRFFLVLIFIGYTQVALGNARQSAVVTAHPLATQAGIEILQSGGNAFDAAVGIAAMLTVVEPYHSGLGGGGFWLCHEKEGHNYWIDARETAPSAAHAKMYIAENGRVNRKLSLQGGLAAAIPGQVAGMEYLAGKGKLSLKKTLAPAIRVAEQGFEIDQKFHDYINYRQNLLRQFPSSQKLLLPNDQPLAEGSLLKQPELAKTLQSLADNGLKFFYQGKMAETLVNAVNQYGGIWTKKDLEEYKIKIRQPLVGEYHGMKITTVGPPSAGGIALLNTLNILAMYELSPLPQTDHIHIVTEALRRSYCDRTQVGDPDFIKVPTDQLISQEHADDWQETIDMNRATQSKTLKCGPTVEENKALSETTHYVVADKQGNYISATLTVNHPFGGGIIADGLGLVINNEMDDFASNVGELNAFGLIGTAPNLIEPNKRPVSSMTPTFVETKQGVALLGTPGGSRIPSMVLLGVLELEENKDPIQWVTKSRFHHQYIPDVLSFEPEAFDEKLQKALSLRGHKLETTSRPYGNMQALFLDNKNQQISIGSDPRGVGKGQVVSEG